MSESYEIMQDSKTTQEMPEPPVSGPLPPPNPLTSSIVVRELLDQVADLTEQLKDKNKQLKYLSRQLLLLGREKL